MALLTRREILETWKKQSDEILDSYCCPSCRDILYPHKKLDGEIGFDEYDDSENNKYLYCHNILCKLYNKMLCPNESEYNIGDIFEW